MSVCIASAGSVLTLLAGSFSLSWTHSVEKTLWIEQWRVDDNRLALSAAGVQGSGAGIDLPPDAVWEGDRWTYTPRLAPLVQLHLAASGATVGGWQLCADGSCYTLGATAGADVTIWATDAVCDAAAVSADRPAPSR